jgi:protein-tyrosine phosphatase
VRPHELRFLHHGIVDCGTTNDLTVLELSLDVCNRLLANEVIYLHCWGGHGRTGTVVAVALGLLYGLPASEALMRTQVGNCFLSQNFPSSQLAL